MHESEYRLKNTTNKLKETKNPKTNKNIHRGR